jgi:serine/threonine-protein kinase
MGTVWAARHELLGRDLALKICGLRGGRSSRDARNLFLREVRIVGKLRHPNVVEIADAGDAGVDGLYLAMELLEGESLAQHIAKGALAPTDALAVAAEVCRGLSAAHAAGVVHRDLKPENVFLARGHGGGVIPKLLDFGVSSARGLVSLQGGQLLGTPAYMSPEQALGEGDIDQRTDVWALGVVLYEMLTGRLPFQAKSYPALLPIIIEAPYPPLPPCIPPEARTVVAGCLAKDRHDRYPTADALLEAIERALASLATTGPSSPRTGFFVETGRAALPSAHGLAEPPAARTARLGPAMAILGFAVAIGLAAIATRIGSRPAPAPADRAPEPDPSPSAAAPPPEPTSSASSVSPAPSASTPARPRGPIRPSRKVTNVNNAGF